MSPLRKTLLVVTLLAAGGAGLAAAQQAPAYDAAQLPETRGKVAQYSLTPRGDVDGLILQDGTEIHFPPNNSAELVYTVRPGDAVTVHGLKARAAQMVMAMSITNDVTKLTVTDDGPDGRREREAAPIEVSSQIKQALHGPRGEVNGVLLVDGTEVRLPPPEAAKLAATLAAGKPLFVRGPGLEGPLGKLVMAREIGGDRNSLTKIAAPPHGGPMERMMGKHMRHHGPGPAGEGPGGPGPDADAPDAGPAGGPPPPPPAPAQ